MNSLVARKTFGLSLLLALPALGVATVRAQAAGDLPAPLNLSSADDHQAMMDQLHITEPLRPGPTGNLANGVRPPNYANYDEDKSHAKTPVPDLMTMANGQKVTTPDQWWNQRRPEIVELFDTYIYGKVPDAAKTVKVTWEVTSSISGMSGTTPVITRQLVGHVDNSSYPLISVNIGASVTTPANATGKVPVIIVFGGGGGGAPGGARGARGARGAPGAPQGPTLAGGAALPTLDNLKTGLTLTDAQADAIKPILDADAQAQKDLTTARDDNTKVRTDGIAQIAAILTADQKTLFASYTNPGNGRGGAARGGAGPGGGGGGGVQMALAHGWGYGSINPASIQADNGGGLTSGGVIALFAKGQERKPDDWGALRAWAWGADRLLDFFATDNLVDGKQVGFEGHSRYGKATIVTLAYDQRAAIGYVSSSGEGGAKIWRHLMGETVENLAGGQEYHWMAGNFLKYGGPLTVDDLPIDAHELVAMVAPRPVFISGGRYDDVGGDSWQDSHGMMQAAAGAGPAYVLLGKKPLSNTALGLTDFTVTSELPPILTPLIDGDVAFRQHDQGHTDAPNWDTFFQFASRYLHAPGAQ
jgi:hypothetical protein